MGGVMGKIASLKKTKSEPSNFKAKGVEPPPKNEFGESSRDDRRFGQYSNFYNDFEILNLLGTGGQGQVFSAAHRGTKKKFAVKMLPLGNRSKREAYAQYLASTVANDGISTNAHVVPMFRVYLLKEKKKSQQPTGYALVMEQVEGGELFDYIKKEEMSEANARYLIRQACLGVKQIHHKGVIHRDLKVENMLLTKNAHAPDVQLKICDFGFSELIKSPPLGGTSGTHLAPEILAKLPYDASVDIWGLGITLFTMCSKRLPFETNKDILSNAPLYPSHFSSELRDLLSKMLCKQGSGRPSIDEILKHPWFSKPMPNDIWSRRKQLPKFKSTAQ